MPLCLSCGQPYCVCGHCGELHITETFEGTSFDGITRVRLICGTFNCKCTGFMPMDAIIAQAEPVADLITSDGESVRITLDDVRSTRNARDLSIPERLLVLAFRAHYTGMRDEMADPDHLSTTSAWQLFANMAFAAARMQVDADKEGQASR